MFDNYRQNRRVVKALRLANRLIAEGWDLVESGDWDAAESKRDEAAEIINRVVR